MKRLLLQALRFFGLSGIGWLLDFGTFVLLGRFSGNVVANNIVSSWVGVTFVFVTATRKVFRSRGRIPLGVKYVLYLAYQCILIFLVSKLLGWISTQLAGSGIGLLQRYAGIIAKILVTPVTMVTNFLVMKGIVEKI